jgi:hypothetical protein
MLAGAGKEIAAKKKLLGATFKRIHPDEASRMIAGTDPTDRYIGMLVSSGGAATHPNGTIYIPRKTGEFKLQGKTRPRLDFAHKGLHELNEMSAMNHLVKRMGLGAPNEATRTKAMINNPVRISTHASPAVQMKDSYFFTNVGPRGVEVGDTVHNYDTFEHFNSTVIPRNVRPEARRIAEQLNKKVMAVTGHPDADPSLLNKERGVLDTLGVQRGIKPTGKSIRNAEDSVAKFNSSAMQNPEVVSLTQQLQQLAVPK